jgi:hypothetical protein
VERVISLANARQAEVREGDLYVGPFYDAVPTAPAELARLREQVLAHPIYGGTLVSKDARATAVLVFFDRAASAEFAKRGLGDEIAGVAREESGGLPIVVTGQPHVKARLSHTIVSELRFILPAVTLISPSCAIAFRTVRGGVPWSGSIALV